MAAFPSVGAGRADPTMGDRPLGTGRYPSCFVFALSRFPALLQVCCNPFEPGLSSQSTAGLTEVAQGTGGFDSASPESVAHKNHSILETFLGEGKRIRPRHGSRADFTGQYHYLRYCVQIGP